MKRRQWSVVRRQRGLFDVFPARSIPEANGDPEESTSTWLTTVKPRQKKWRAREDSNL